MPLSVVATKLLNPMNWQWNSLTLNKDKQTHTDLELNL